jgi:transcriptional repressor NrdR
MAGGKCSTARKSWLDCCGPLKNGPFTYEQIQSLTNQIENEIRASGENEVKSTRIGEVVMAHLEKIDQIAYVRFASVYRQFADVNSFMQEIQNMLDKGKQK